MSLQTFPSFPQLPIELQLQIWSYVIDEAAEHSEIDDLWQYQEDYAWYSHLPWKKMVEKKHETEPKRYGGIRDLLLHMLHNLIEQVTSLSPLQTLDDILYSTLPARTQLLL